MIRTGSARGPAFSGETMTKLIGTLAAALVACVLAIEGVSAQAGACDRQCLEAFVDRYLDALVKHDPKAVPLAANVRFTENGQRLAVGDGMWRSLKSKGSYRLFVSDVEAQQVAFIGTLHEQHNDPTKSNPVLVALRLKIAGDRISEIEQLVVRNADTAARVEKLGEPRAQFLTAVPDNQRMSRADLIATANKYFSG